MTNKNDLQIKIENLEDEIDDLGNEYDWGHINESEYFDSIDEMYTELREANETLSV